MAVYHEVNNFGLNDLDVATARKRQLDRLLIQRPISLKARTLNCRTLASVEQPELNSGTVSGSGHDAIERVDLANEMPLAQASNRRITGHHANPVSAHGYKRDGYSEPGRRISGLNSGMTGAHNNDVIVFHVKQNLLSDAEC